MRVPFLDLKAQYAETRHLSDPAVQEIFENGAFVLGKHNTALEGAVAALHHVKHAITVNSGTDALRIAMQACGIGPGDEVITTAFTFVASVETIVQLGARPVFVDIDPETYDLNPDHLAQAVTARTRAVLPIHLFGQLAPMERIAQFCSDNGLLLLEDAAQAIGTDTLGKFAGQWGKASGISFYVTKNVGAAGDGGIILTDDDEVAERSRSLRVHGMGRERYFYDDIGYTSRMAEIQAAVIMAKLSKLDAWNARRRDIAAMYSEGLDGAYLKLPVTREGNTNTWHQYTVLHPRREELMAQLKAAEIDSAIYYPVPIHLHSPYAEFGHGAGSLPVTEEVSQQCLSLPVQPHLSDAQVHHVIESALVSSRAAAGVV